MLPKNAGLVQNSLYWNFMLMMRDLISQCFAWTKISILLGGVWSGKLIGVDQMHPKRYKIKAFIRAMQLKKRPGSSMTGISFERRGRVKE